MRTIEESRGTTMEHNKLKNELESSNLGIGSSEQNPEYSLLHGPSPHCIREHPLSPLSYTRASPLSTVFVTRTFTAKRGR